MPTRPASRPGRARLGGVSAEGVVETADLTQDADALRPGWWALVGDFEGRVRAWRFGSVARAVAGPGSEWTGPDASQWRSSLDEPAYVAAVEAVRGRIREGDVYQANLCRILAAPSERPDAEALAAVLAAGNPAPYQGFVDVPPTAEDEGACVVTASPELYLDVRGRRVTSAPIKGTARTEAELAEKDRAENVMITDLVRNDLQQVCVPGTVAVTSLLAAERHPGLVHLVSTVSGRLADEVVAAGTWSPLLAATYPPGSVSGAPKRSALALIRELEPAPRGPYCGLVGWARVDRSGALTARLAVGIRTFWWDEGELRFGTGAGITWGSDARREWAETELKAERLVALASRTD